MSTPQNLINIAVDAGRTIDVRFPGLRERDNEAWMAKVAYLASRDDVRIGRKSRGPGARISPDTVGIRMSVNSGPADAMWCVSIIRDNPPVNEWRNTPLDYGEVRGQLWIEAEATDIGGNVPEPEPPPSDSDLNLRVQRLEQWARGLSFKD